MKYGATVTRHESPAAAWALAVDAVMTVRNETIQRLRTFSCVHNLWGYFFGASTLMARARV